MPEIDPKDVIWIQDAMKEFSTTRYIINQMIDQRKLTVIKMPGQGDKIYLLRSELEKQLRPQIIQRRAEEDAG
jgi:hypothetical protein